VEPYVCPRDDTNNFGTSLIRGKKIQIHAPIGLLVEVFHATRLCYVECSHGYLRL
jgi:hypothetical protein